MYLLILLMLSYTMPGVSAVHNHSHGSRVERNIQFSPLSVKDGLAQVAVHAIVQDHHGFIWFGTQEGLSRYNGYRFDNYFHDADNPSSLSHDWIWDLLVDSSGNLWIGTDGGGLNHFDWDSGTFLQYAHKPTDPTSLSNDRVRVIYQTDDGSLWIGTDGGGLNRLALNGQGFSHFRHDSNDPKSLPNDKVLAILEDQNGFLWIGTDGGGLAHLNPATGRFDVYQHDPSRNNSISSNRVRALYEDSQGNIWIGTDGGGLNLFDPRRGAFQRFLHDSKDPSTLSNDSVHSIVQDYHGVLWIGTSNGLNQWTPESEGFLRYANDPANSASLIDDRVKSIIQDRGGVLWIGTANGVCRWNYVSDAFVYYGKTNDSDSYLGSNLVTAIDQGIDGQVWVGTYGGGLSMIDTRRNVTTHYLHNPDNPESLSSDEVMSVFVDRVDQVWVGTRKNGLNQLNIETGMVRRYRHDASDPYSLSGDGITRIHGDPDGTLWVATYGGGLNRMSPGSGDFEVFRHDPEDPNSLSSDRVLALYRDSTDILWVGTEDGGLNELDEANGLFKRYQHDQHNVKSLGSDTAWEILEGKDGSLWIGTNGGGLNRWLPEDRRMRRNRFKKYAKQEGLNSNTIHAILQEDDGALWLSSNRGLTRLDPFNGNVRYFDNLNALKSNDFITGASQRGSDGSLMFGGTEGLVIFHPDRIHINRQHPPVAVTALNHLRPLANSFSIDKVVPLVSLEHTDYSVTFEFAALDFTSPDKNRYRYRLEGFDRDWIDPHQYRRATYTNLPADNYLFQVQAGNNDGVWNDEGAAIELLVHPPPWRSAWAYALYGISILGLLGLYVYFQYKKSRWEAHQRARLEEQVQLRTLELSDRNNELEELNCKLKEASLTDSLTGLKNRRFLYEHIGTEVAWTDRRVAEVAYDQGGSFTLDDGSGKHEYALFFMMIDLDGFKKINDTHGHNAGDQALLQVRNILIDCCRASDIVIRWGGDEFLIVGRSSGRASTERFAERLRKNLAEHAYDLGNGETGLLSGSIGFAHYPFVLSTPSLLQWENVVGIADQAAYIAKQNQRNAWVGIYSQATVAMSHALLDIRDDLEGLAQCGIIEINTSITEELAAFKSQSRRAVQ